MTSILGRVLSICEKEPDRLFARVWPAVGEPQDVTYRDLVDRAAGMAAALGRGGARPGDVVVVIVKPGATLLSAWLAPLLAGAIPSIFPWPTEKLSAEYYDGSVSALLSICGATALLTSADLRERLASLAAAVPTL